MQYRQLGASGLMVSELSLGTMTFGGEMHFKAMGNIQADEARRLVDLCFDAGMNLFDTADMYSAGKSEEVLAAALAGRRDRAIIATKAFARTGTGVHDVGLSRQHLITACEASLRRLKTDYIDLYQVHSFDCLTPVEETLRALDDLVRSGKVRYIGSSNHAGWQLMKALATSDRNGLARYIGQQINYSLLARDAENELMPLGLDQGVGILVWSPLQFGLLSGKFRRGAPKPEQSRLNELDEPGNIDHEQLYRIVDVLDGIARERSATVPQIALNWLLRKPCVANVIIGVRNEAQLKDLLATTNFALSADEVARLDEVSARPEPYPHWHQHKYGAERNPRLPAMRSQ